MIPYQLTTPIDFEVLEVFSDGRRNIASNIALELDRNRSYINVRLAKLANQQLLTKIGPNQQSGLYQITPTGVAAVTTETPYDDDPQEFTRVVGEMADSIQIEPPTIHKSN